MTSQLRAATTAAKTTRPLHKNIPNNLIREVTRAVMNIAQYVETEGFNLEA